MDKTGINKKQKLSRCVLTIFYSHQSHLPGKLKGAELNGSSAMSVYVITRLSRLLTLEIPTIFIISLKTWTLNLEQPHKF